jgi:REP element-mobilizing transposase RayT
MLFRDDIDCVAFLDGLAAVSDGLQAQIHAYALLPDHFHLLVEVPQGNLSAVMRWLGTGYAAHCHRRHNTEGSVFRGRYHSKVIDDDATWQHLLGHLHLNPVRARLATHPNTALWTSHSAYIDPPTRPDWLVTAPITQSLGSAEAVRRFVDGVWTKSIPLPVGFGPSHFWTPTDSHARPDMPRRTPAQALGDVASLLQVPAASLRTRPRGPTPNPGPWLYIWWLLRSTGWSQGDVAKHLGVGRARVSQLHSAMVALAEREPHWRLEMDRLDRLLSP